MCDATMAHMQLSTTAVPSNYNGSLSLFILTHCLFPSHCRSVNAAMNLFGDSHELDNAGKAGKAGAVRWINFWYGCFAGIVPWACVFAYVGGVAGGSGIPGFVWAILFVYLALFLTFPVNMWLQYKGVGWWGNARWADSGIDNGGYLFGEKVYQILSLVAKSLLLWLVIGGANQPNTYTQ